MSIKLRIIIIFLIVLGLLGGIVYSMNLLAVSTQQTANAELRRFQSHNLADQLRQSSDDLTRMARTYVVTGDAIYEQYFYEILAIRNGTSPRPEKYSGIYWDLVTARNEEPTSQGKRTALIDLMKQTGMTDRELKKLKEALDNSNRLAIREQMAFGAMKGMFADGTGKLTIHLKPNPGFARKLLHDKQYHKVKADIMRPIGEFLDLVDDRTSNEVKFNRADEVLYRQITIVLTLITILFSIFAFFHIRWRVLNPIVSLSKAMTQTTPGAIDDYVAVASNDEIGVLNKAFTELNNHTKEIIVGLEYQVTERKKLKLDLRRFSNPARRLFQSQPSIQASFLMLMMFG